ncbi:MAG: YjbF family lipoprotein [Albidovulum sp.]
MSLRQSWGARRLALAGLLAAGTVLASCGSDTSKTEGGRIALETAKGLASKILPGKKGSAAPNAPDPETLAAAAKSSISGPIVLAQIETTGLLTVLGEIGRNGATRTYATPNQQTLLFRNGLLVGSRGLGDDLMSADLGNAAALVTRRQSGATNRTYRYLDGEAIERPLPVQCTITTGGTKSFRFAETNYATVQMDERCQSRQGLNISNTYWVTADGQVALSRQWIGPTLGHVTIQLVRP